MFVFSIFLIIIFSIAINLVGIIGFIKKESCAFLLVLAGLFFIAICSSMTLNSYERTGTVVGKEIDGNSYCLIIEYKNDFMKIEVDDVQYKYKNKGDTLKFSFYDKYEEE